MKTNQWLNYKQQNNGPLSNYLIKQYLSNFWLDIMSKIDSSQYILILFKVVNNIEETKSVSYVQRVNNNDFISLYNIFIEFWDIKSEEYHQMDVIEVNFTYKILDNNSNKQEEIKKSKISEHIKLNDSNKSTSLNIKGFNLFPNMNYEEWGESHQYRDSMGNIKIIVYKAYTQSEYHVTKYNEYNEIEVINNNKTIFIFKDTPLNSLNQGFKRTFKNQEIWYEDGKKELSIIKRKCKFITSIKPSLSLTEKFITMDIETRSINGVFYAYCVSIFDGENVSTFFLSEYNNPDELLESAILSIMKRKYNGYKVYLHNFSKFDGVFLLKILTKLSDDVKPIINNNNFIKITFKFSSYYLHFRDSYLLLPSSLKNLAKVFNVDQKGIFPVLFLNNKENQLNYIGNVPSFSNFVDLEYSEYLTYKKQFKLWDLKKECIKYCNQDVITLHQIIKYFSNFIFEDIRLDIFKYPTLSSLAFAIYRSKFLGKYKIPVLNGKIYNDIKNAYTGGSVDVFKPYGENIYHYDVNSLYPYVMREFKMPIGTPRFFEGDVLKYFSNPYGFFYVDIQAPEEKDLKIPLLQTKVKINNSIKTISPLGNWKGWYFSEEIYKAIKLGYKIKIHYGYLFDQDVIFKEYVDYFYNIKLNNNKDTPNYIIAKFILNSLYGRLGMNPTKNKHVIVNSTDSYKYYDKFTVSDVMSLDNKEMISYLDINKNNDSNNFFGSNVCVAVSAAVTAQARLFMHDFKNKYYNNLFYTDTDSIAINKELDSNFVGTKIGQFKLEYFSKKSIFLSPKVYFSLTNEQEICKLKGFNLSKNKDITFSDFENLLVKNNKLILNQDKWYKHFSQGNITVKNELDTLTHESGKRKPVYDENNKFINTKSLVLRDGLLLEE